MGGLHCFSEIGHQGRWKVAHKKRFICHLSVSPVPDLGRNNAIPQKWYNSLDTNFKFCANTRSEFTKRLSSFGFAQKVWDWHKICKLIFGLAHKNLKQPKYFGTCRRTRHIIALAGWVHISFFKILECQFWFKKSTTLYARAENYWNNFFSLSIAIKIIEVEKGSHSNFLSCIFVLFARELGWPMSWRFTKIY